MTLAVNQTIIGARRMLGATLAQRREAQGRTQDGLASKVRLSRSSIANIESGRQAQTSGIRVKITVEMTGCLM